jgi:hypothetical protein
MRFKPYMDSLESELSENGSRSLTNLIFVPAYLTILSTIDSNEFINVLKHYLITLSLRDEDLSGLQIAVVKYCGQDGLQEHVLSGLWDGNIYIFQNNNSIYINEGYLNYVNNSFVIRIKYLLIHTH